MNYLAHFYLSNNDKNLIIGNYIADDVKGKAFLNYPEDIQKGILLHRKIDEFTDSHPIVTHSKDIIRDHQKKYTPVVMDVFYDYFLAKNWKKDSEVNLLDFTTDIYKTLFKNINHLPLTSKARLPFMAKSNWLYNYRKIEGINRALTGLSKRSNYPNNMHQASIILQEKETDLNQDFELFFPEIIKFADSEI